MDHEADPVKRIAILEELLCDLANAVSMGCDAEAAVVARSAQDFLHTGECVSRPYQGGVADLTAQLAERDAMTATAVKIARRQAFGEASIMLLRLAAQRRGQTSLADAARIIGEMQDTSAPAEIDTCAVLARLKQKGIEPTMTADEVLKLTREVG